METTPNPPLPPAPAPAAPAAATATGSHAKIIYVLYLLSLAFGVTSLVGVIMAYVYQGDAPDWLKTHHRFQIRTFWIGVLYSAIGAILVALVVGFLVWGFVAVWLIVRCVKGIRALDRREPVPNVETWLW
jgi:uncharacterized membrane protein